MSSASEEEYVALVTSSQQYLTEKQARLKSVFGLGNYARYDWNQDTGQIIFSDAGVPKIVAEIQFVGSTSTISGTWLWAWANSTIDPRWSTATQRVRSYGKEHGIWPLMNAKWSADEADGWEMTSIAAKLLEAEGAYRSPGENGATFLLLYNVRWASADPSKP